MKDFAFLGKKGFWRFILLFVCLFLLMVGETIINYNYVITQKSVQEGNMALWHNFLLFGMSSIAIGLICTLMAIFSQMWLVKTQKINFFLQFDGTIQTGKKEICLKVFNFENAKVSTIVEIVQAIISMVYTIMLMQIVTMTVPQLIGAGAILVASIVFGIRRGTLQQKADNIGAQIQTKQELLSNNFMISSHVLDERLGEINKSYWKQITTQLIKNFIRGLPEVIKVICFLAFMWAIADAKITEGTPYSYACIIFAAYGYIVKFANEIGNIVEDASKIIHYAKDEEIRMLKKEELQRKELSQLQKANVEFENGLVIHHGFTANVSHSDRPDSWYEVPSTLEIPKGQMILLEGENETGKSRFNRFIRELIPETIIYDSHTAISSTLAENFVIDGKVDFQLVRRLAMGIGIISRIPESEKEFRDVKFGKQLNSADVQRLIALQILYFAIKEHEKNPEKTQLIILDEIIANVSEENTLKMLEFIKLILSQIGACSIIVSHTHKEAVCKCISQTWYMRNDGTKITITTT